jgi:hypothetical protein
MRETRLRRPVSRSVELPGKAAGERYGGDLRTYDRPVRAAFIGLGRIYDLNVRAYGGYPDVEVVALVDPSEERRAQR